MIDNELDDCERIDPRDARALTEVMSVLDEHDPRVSGADDLFLVVSSSGSEYLVDAREGTCECPDHQYRDAFCKHLRRVTYETGMRPLPAWINHDAVDDQLGEHVSATPRVAPAGVATDGGTLEGDESDVDVDAAADECECVDGADLPCWSCYRQTAPESDER